MEATRWLGHATRLAGTGAGRPPIVDLRRGVSAAYYALYHGLTGHAAAHALPGLPTEQMALRRSYGHGTMKSACTWVMGSAKPGGQRVRRIIALANGDARMVRVAETFIDLQQGRHDADYDHTAAFSKSAVTAAVAQSANAVRDLEDGRGADGYIAFMALLTLGARDLR
jgi:hypothetical protein